MQIVPISDIPLAQDCPIDDLDSLQKLCNQLAEFCTSQLGIGINAVQVGIPYNLYLVRNFDKYRIFVNCSYSPVKNDKHKSVEGCLSIRNEKGQIRVFEVDRYFSVRIVGKELIDGKLVDVDFVSGNVVHQHELDHSLNILISQIGKEI